MRKIRKIVIHTSDSPDTVDIGAKEIREWHLDRGWTDIGYHYVIRRNGQIEQGRKESVVGAHVYGHNSDSIGICWVGRDNMTQQQYEVMHALCVMLRYKYVLDVDQVIGHRELAPGKKTCPNINMDKFRASLVFKIAGGIRSIMDV